MEYNILWSCFYFSTVHVGSRGNDRCSPREAEQGGIHPHDSASLVRQFVDHITRDETDQPKNDDANNHQCGHYEEQSSNDESLHFVPSGDKEDGPTVGRTILPVRNS